MDLKKIIFFYLQVQKRFFKKCVYLIVNLYQITIFKRENSIWFFYYIQQNIKKKNMFFYHFQSNLCKPLICYLIPMQIRPLEKKKKTNVIKYTYSKFTKKNTFW
uniref:(northern house mosquito) hypothetical protein n=1 Tax=Culex pipiens TaxID=7175 RepID=A0A8D8CTQ8_CULPI